MSAVNENVFSHGMQDTRETLDVWREQRWVVLRAWAALSLAIALALLAATWFVAGLAAPGLNAAPLPAAGPPACLDPALGSRRPAADPRAQRGGARPARTACVAGFIAGASMP